MGKRWKREVVAPEERIRLRDTPVNFGSFHLFRPDSVDSTADGYVPGHPFFGNRFTYFKIAADFVKYGAQPARAPARRKKLRMQNIYILASLLRRQRIARPITNAVTRGVGNSILTTATHP
jgi:hypothetical protein